MNVRTTTIFALTAILAAAGTSLAQTGQPGGGGRRPGGEGGQPGGQPGGPGGPGGGGGNLVERLLQSDANGDGMLQWDEVPEQMRERIFERNDTNKDKVLDKAELEAMRQRASGRQGGPGGPSGEAASMGDSMEAAGRAMRTLRRSEFNALSRTQDLRAVGSLQSALIAAKGDMGSATMSEAAKAKYKDDAAAYQRDFRKSIIKSAMLALELELAINDGDSAAATKTRDAILAHQEASHELFQVAEAERPAGEPGAGGGRGRGQGGGGGGGGQNGQPGGGGRPPR